MHLIMLLSSLVVAWGLRYTWSLTSATAWSDRRQQTLGLFLLSPLLLFTSAIAIIWMGPSGRMVWLHEGLSIYYLAIFFLVAIAIYFVKLVWDSERLLHQIRTYPTTQIDNYTVRILDSIAPYSAQIGFWQPELVITQGLLDTLEIEHIQAVLAHERAHERYHDTFWFFWLGWVRRITSWLPQTEAMWQELLVLRELRADRWASQQTDPLLVAEALLLVVQNTSIYPEAVCAAFNNLVPIDRLTQRIDALFATEIEDLDRSVNWWSHLWVLLAILPLAIVPFHH